MPAPAPAAPRSHRAIRGRRASERPCPDSTAAPDRRPRATRTSPRASPAEKIMSMYGSLSRPTPCSPVIVPPAFTHAVMISRIATCTRAVSSASEASYAMFGCRLPSPAWNTLHTRSRCCFADALNLGEHLGQPRARYDGVLHDEVRRDAPHRAERFLASLPEARALRPRRARRAPSARRCSCRAPRPSRRRARARRRAVQLDQQRRGRVGRIAGGVDRRLHGADRRLVDHLERGGNDSRRHDRRHGARRRVERHEIREQRANRLGISREPHRDLERDAEAPLRSDERADQVVAFVLAVGVAERHDFAVGRSTVSATM